MASKDRGLHQPQFWSNFYVASYLICAIILLLCVSTTVASAEKFQQQSSIGVLTTKNSDRLNEAPNSREDDALQSSYNDAVFLGCNDAPFLKSGPHSICFAQLSLSSLRQVFKPTAQSPYYYDESEMESQRDREGLIPYIQLNPLVSAANGGVRVRLYGLARLSSPSQINATLEDFTANWEHAGQLLFDSFRSCPKWHSDSIIPNSSAPPSVSEPCHFPLPKSTWSRFGGFDLILEGQQLWSCVEGYLLYASWFADDFAINQTSLKRFLDTNATSSNFNCPRAAVFNTRSSVHSVHVCFDDLFSHQKTANTCPPFEPISQEKRFYWKKRQNWLKDIFGPNSYTIVTVIFGILAVGLICVRHREYIARFLRLGPRGIFMPPGERRLGTNPAGVALLGSNSNSQQVPMVVFGPQEAPPIPTEKLPSYEEALHMPVLMLDNTQAHHPASAHQYSETESRT